ncbi:MAG: neutral/alkaline non-lysosomal ceramidase N-terminal domain-containing protein [Hungatella hathewayi]
MRTLGISKVCITPQKPVRLCGFGFRTGVYDGVRRDIFVRVFDLREESERAVFIYGDLLWWNSEFVDRMRREMMETLGIPKEQLLFVASHNHSGPGTGNSFVPLLETADEEYLDYLASRILEAVRQAGENQEEVTLVRSDGSCALNVFRRVKTKQGIAMRPNYDVEPDRTLTVFSFYRADKTLKGRLVHYPCHANLSKDNELHPDYPGYALERLDRENPGSVHMFLQGCTADMRPNCVLGDQFRAGTKADVEAFADYFCEAVGEAVGNAVGNVVESAVGNAAGNTEGSTINNGTPVTPGMTLSIRQHRLPLVQNFTKEDMETYAKDSREEIRQWAAKVQEKKLRDYETLEVAALSLGKEKLYFLNAEVSMHYAKFLREQYPGAICAGYTNGMIGYLSSAVQIREGGYEPQESAVYFALAGTYKEEIQDIIETALV